VVLLKRIKQPVRNARIRPTAHPGVNGVPFAKAGWQSTPLTAVFRDKQDRIDHRQV